MSFKHWLKFLLLGFIASAAAGPPDANTAYHTVNASAIGNSSTSVNWLNESNQTRVPCTPNCTYLRISTANIAPDSGTKFSPANWPDNAVTSMPVPINVDRSASFIPPNGDTKIYQSNMLERAAVEYFRTGDAQITSKVFMSGGQASPNDGTAAAAMAYHIVVQNVSASKRDYFIHFYAPNSLDTRYFAYNVMNYQNFYIAQDHGKGRSTVDVLVNGLPVWSTGSSYFFPEDFGGQAYEGFATEWGSSSTNDEYRIFIGRFNAGATFNIDYIVRADSVARGSSCGHTSPIGTPPQPVYATCYLVTDGRALPAITGSERLEIYSTAVSTLINPPGTPIPLP